MKYAFWKKCITPKMGTGLAGFLRKPTSTGVYDDIYLQMLLLEDDQGRRLLLSSLDLLGLDTSFVRKMRRWIGARDRRLSPDAITFSCTHTHCGPATCTIVPSAGKMNPEYMAFLEKSIKEGAQTLISGKLQPGQLRVGQGRCELAINRRSLAEVEVNGVKKMAWIMKPNHEATIDPVLGLLQVKGKDEEIIVLNYACHPTTRAGYNVSGDYPGAAVRALRADSYGRREVMFLQGGGGDLRIRCLTDDQVNFKPGDAEKVIEFGNLIAASARKVLKKGLRPIKADFAAAGAEALLPYDHAVDISDLKMDAECTRLMRQRLRAEGKEGVRLAWSVWRLGADCVLMALPGEVCHNIGLNAKKLSRAKFPFFLGYANGNPTYIPTDEIIRQGGYEGRDATIVYGHPKPFQVGSEQKIYAALKKALAAINGKTK